MNKLPCPYCHNLMKPPKRKTKCLHCGQMVWMKLAPGEKEKRMVTTGQAMSIDRAWVDLDMRQNNPDDGLVCTIRIEGDQVLRPPKPRPLAGMNGDELLDEIIKQP